MCDSDPPAPPPPREPEFLVNPFDDLDNEERAAAAARRGTGALRTSSTGLGIGFSGRGGAAAPTASTPSTGLGIGPRGSSSPAVPVGMAPRTPRPGYTPFAPTAGLGHTAQQRQQQMDEQLIRQLTRGLAL